MRFNPNDDFMIRPLTDDQVGEVMEYMRARRNFGLLGSIAIFIAIYLALFRHRWLAALALWVIANISHLIAKYYELKVEDIGL